jgi:CheY-like chemotaxis protein
MASTVSTNGEPVPSILLVEDNPADARLAIEAFRENRLDNPVHVVNNGEEAVEYLKNCKKQDLTLPSLILLDLNLPRKDGREVLAEVKADAAFKSIPVVVLTTSQAPDDIRTVYSLNGNCYVTKNPDIEQFIETVRLLGEFWLKTVRLPPPG